MGRRGGRGGLRLEAGGGRKDRGGRGGGGGRGERGVLFEGGAIDVVEGAGDVMEMRIYLPCILRVTRLCGGKVSIPFSFPQSDPPASPRKPLPGCHNSRRRNAPGDRSTAGTPLHPPVPVRRRAPLSSVYGPMSTARRPGTWPDAQAPSRSYYVSGQMAAGRSTQCAGAALTACPQLLDPQVLFPG